MKLKYDVQDAVQQLGLNTLRKPQIGPINAVLDKHDTLVIYPTAFGKSAIMQVPALVIAPKLTLVIEPTVSLMYDQVRYLQELGIAAEYLAQRNRRDHSEIRDRLEDGEIHILYIAPERLQSGHFRDAIKLNPPWLIVIDEAHCYLNSGRTFRPDYLEIPKFIESLPNRPVILAMTATAPKEYRKQLTEHLGMKKPETFTAPLARPNLTIIRERMHSETDKKRWRRIRNLISKYGQEGRIVVYCATKRDTDIVYNHLTKAFPKEVVECHAFMDADSRESHEMKFIQNKRRIMVATNSFGMGVDVPDIRLVIHYSLPISPINYYQEIGRAGRDGNKSRCILLYHPDDTKKFSRILKNIESDEMRDELASGIDRMLEIASGDTCIMERLLEELDDDNPYPCGHCSVCQSNRRQ